MQESEVHTLCMDIQVKSRTRSMPGCYPSPDHSLLACWSILYVGIQLYGFRQHSPIDMYIHVAHTSIVEGKVMHLQEGVCLGCPQQILPIDTTGSISLEIHSVEVDQIEEIGQIEVLHIHGKCICLLTGDSSVECQISVIV